MYMRRIKNKIIVSTLFHYVIKISFQTISFFLKNKNKNLGLLAGKKTLIIYSRHAYDHNGVAETFLEQSGGVRLIKSIIRDIGLSNIVYLGQEESFESLPKIYDVDQIIGINCLNTLLAFKKYRYAHKVYLAVNQAIPERNSILMRLQKKHGLSLSPMEIVNPITELNLIGRCNTLLVLGNKVVLRSFENVYKVSGQLINNVKSNFFCVKSRSEEKIYDVIYPTSYLCVRKGLAEILDISRINEENPSPLKILIVGGHDHVYKKIYDELGAMDNVTLMDWLSPSDLRNVYGASKICLLWSHEEGQVSTILEAIESGCIPVVTPECGLPLDERLSIFDSNSSPVKIYELVRAKVDAYSPESLKNLNDYYEDNFLYSIFKKNGPESILPLFKN